ncbi:hypothetical protein BFW01_g12793 [Lasiodiplodia theobromae]|uniref:DUF7730 domain-containing protein n=1 Tax=Lasiodiplodia theobromae TaxID=45133 RepID=A0A5N5D7Q5_9PEZI|nr:hypothetical protein DBV05_g8029 [Lasiodiplodia theobromae]KAF9640987.1 hypothetical protein BFW01_g12793 [Lasiodiplodia theobromae]
MNEFLPGASKSFRLLNLPAELRLRIYEHALTAPDKAIRIYYSYQKDRVKPGLVLPLLRTCRQVHAEALEVLYENTVCVHANANRIGYPIIGSSQLPPPALANLRHLFIVLDVSDPPQLADDDYIDFRPFQAMVRLRRLRIAAVDEPEELESLEGWTDLLSHIIERVPSTCKLEYGTSNEDEKHFTARYCYSLGTLTTSEVPGDLLMRAAAYSQVQQGCKSGSDVDWRDSAAASPSTLDEVRTW